jgi:serine/threonine-protein kinase RsbW
MAVLERDSDEEVVENFSSTKEFEIPSRRDLIRGVLKEIMDYVNELDIDVKFMRLVLEEALSNAMEHGNKFDHSKTILIEVEITGSRLVIRVRDRGKGFDHNNVPDPTSEEALWKRRGRGIFLMRKLMDEVTYSRNGSEITLLKNL